MTLKSFFIYLFIMAVSTYLIRVIPFVLVKHQIKNRFISSFLHYIPYAVLTAMTIPAIFFSTGNIYTAIAGTIVALILAYFNKPLIVVALSASAAAFLTGLLLGISFL